MAPGDTRSVLARAFTMLAAFDASGDGLSLAELARLTGLPKATLHRLTAQLTELGALERIGDTYYMGLRLFEFARSVPIQQRLREVALPFMADLYEATHETVHLGIMTENDVLYVERIAGHKQVCCPTRVGGRMPVHCTGLGKAMLAHVPEETLQLVISGGLKPLTPYTIVMPRLLREQLSRIRETGVAFDREEAVLGVVCIAAPLLLNGEPIGAISVTGPKMRLRVENLASAVRTTAITLSRHIRRSELAMLGASETSGLGSG